MIAVNKKHLVLIVSLFLSFAISFYWIITGTYGTGYERGYEQGTIDATKNFDDLQVNRIIQMDQVWKYAKEREVSNGNKLNKID